MTTGRFILAILAMMAVGTVAVLIVYSLVGYAMAHILKVW